MNRISLPTRVCVACLAVAAWVAVATAADELPGWWPAEVPVVEGAEVVEIDHAEEKGLPSVSFKVGVEQHSMESLIALYREQLAGLGWSLGSERDTGLTRSVTATKESLDKRVIVTAKKPGSLFNRDRAAILLEVIVYPSIPD